MTDNVVKMKSFDERAKIERADEIYQFIHRLANPPSRAEMNQIQKCIDAGADLERHYNGNKDFPLNSHETLLHLAITREYTDAALLLLKGGADMNTKCMQNITPFIWAAMKGDVVVQDAMLKSGKAPPPDRDVYDSMDDGKLTALMCAARAGRQETAQALIRHGADLNFKNDIGKSALDFATEKHPEVAQQLQKLWQQLAGEKESALMAKGTVNSVKPMRPLQLKRGAP